MALSNLLPRTINTTGASCSGSDGDPNRTYTLSDSGIITSGFNITVNGTTLHSGAGNDYTLSDNIITFLNVLWDDSIITIDYFIEFGASSSSSLLTSTSIKYATPLMLAEDLGIMKEIPSWEQGTTPSKELVGTGNDSDTTFYLDQKSVISDSYSLYYGPDANTLTALTETTHYVLDNDSGKIVLTDDGVTAVGTNKIYAEYKYYSNGMKDSFIIATIKRAEKQVDNKVNSTFTDGTQTNPSFPIITEIMASEGTFNDRIILSKKPLIDIQSQLDGSITDSDVTISLISSQGGEQFPSSGYIIIGSEVITYTGIDGDDLTGCTRGVLGTTAASHNSGDEVHSTIVFRSDTVEGTEASWTIQPWHSSIYANEFGLVYKFDGADPAPLSRQGVAERIKIIYLYGYDSVPEDITRLALIFAKKILITNNIGKAMIQGRNEFKPEMYDVDSDEIERIINSYIILPMGNT